MFESIARVSLKTLTDQLLKEYSINLVGGKDRYIFEK